MSQCWACKCIISRSTENRSQSELTNVKSALDSDSASELELAPAIQVRGFGRFINNKKARRNFYWLTTDALGELFKGYFQDHQGKYLLTPLKWMGYEIHCQHLKHLEFNTAVNCDLPAQRGKTSNYSLQHHLFSLPPVLKFKLLAVPYPC